MDHLLKLDFLDHIVSHRYLKQHAGLFSVWMSANLRVHTYGLNEAGFLLFLMSLELMGVFRVEDVVWMLRLGNYFRPLSPY